MKTWEKFVRAGCLLGALALGWAPGAHSQDARGRADKIIKQTIQARGGKKALAKVTTVNFEGTVATPGGGPSGSYSLIGKAPGQMYQEIRVGAERLSEGSNGISVWRQEDAGGPVTLRGAEAGALVARARLLNGALLDYKKQKLNAEFVGMETENGQKQAHVRVRFAHGATGELYFDAGTHMLARELFPGAGAEAVDEADYADYRTVSGVAVPFRMTIRRGGHSFEIAMTKVVINTAVENTAFEFPTSSTAPLPEIARLVKDLQKNQAAVEVLVKTYTYHEIDEEDGDEADDSGTPNKRSVKEYDVFYLGGRKYRGWWRRMASRSARRNKRKRTRA
jgi:hypothetical protein